jgi:transposase
MIVIGADAHKRSHMLAAVDGATGVLVAELEIRANEDGHRRMLRWARALAEERVWAIEDCRGLTGRLEQALLGAASALSACRRS